MRHVLATAGKIALGCIAVATLAGLAIVGAYLGLGLSAGTLRLPVTPAEETVSGPAPAAPSATPAEIVATRFPTEEEAPAPVPTFSTASVIPGEHEEPFDLDAVSGLAAVEPPWPATEGTSPAAGSLEESDITAQINASLAQPRTEEEAQEEAAAEAFVAEAARRQLPQWEWKGDRSG